MKDEQAEARIVVTGRIEPVGFLIEPHRLKLSAASDYKALLLAINAGAEFIMAAIDASIVPSTHSPTAKYWPSTGNSGPVSKRLFRVQIPPEKENRERKEVNGDGMVPQLQLRDYEEVVAPFLQYRAEQQPPAEAPGENDILLQWVGESPAEAAAETPTVSCKCRTFIRIGDLSQPALLPEPAGETFIVTSLHSVLPKTRVRKSLSYESILVDVLRLWRKYGDPPVFTPAFLALLGMAKAAGAKEDPASEKLRQEAVAAKLAKPLSVIIRINHSALLLYRLQKTAEPYPKDIHEEVWIYHHQGQTAPLEESNLGRIEGFTGFVGAQIAAAAHVARQADSDGWLPAALARCILWQDAFHHLGLFKLLFSRKGEGWAPIEGLEWRERSAFFEELHAWAKLECEKYPRPETPPEQPNLHKQSGRVQAIKIKIQDAVSHRMQWFLAADCLRRHRRKGGELEMKESFQAAAHGWLTDSKRKPEDDIPIVQIEKLPLMDRREVEDFLAIRDAFRSYRHTSANRPLNIAVFGPPGAGKSFGVKQVTTHIAGSDPSFNKDSRTFNVSQFNSLADLFNALHQVRSECLKGSIPVIFFDEFDSSFESRPFGWLKYFLAPMQDGEFMEGGTEYRLGRCVMVFAGGVNRSFDELNGRLRNPPFVEAKGPDFISRLRGHLNIRGINKPEDEVDQDRYILRRAILLRNMLKERLELPNGVLPPKLLDDGVARAFCSVPSFKHGARSLEAILDMCDLKRGQMLGPSDLPAKTQLEMHVDAAAFLNALFEKK